ncbi:uncharacterized protein LOC122278573 [Carya illinoinensis]|uniref:uncharacterized protein LOC122278573 n=1 Tax=Carya illinoinensis TaxID=32201 RepID=UPI001C71F479|nr:uncharacterized protein LOC122278573 [Carya illinoinensis]
MIEEIFSEFEAAVVVKLPISPCRSLDQLTWHCTTNGKFSIRFAYHFQGAISTGYSGQSSSPAPSSALWANIWKLKILHLVRTLLWRAAKDILPTKVNLFKRKVLQASKCPICLTHPETVTHALWSCKAAQAIWSECLRKVQKCSVMEGPFNEVLSHIFSTLSGGELNEVAYAIKHIWQRRNKWAFESQFASPQQVIKSVASNMSDLHMYEENLQKQKKKSADDMIV